MFFRIGTIVLGIGLFVSAFVWPHSPEQYANTWILGMLCVAFGLVALVLPKARYLNTALAAWLFVSSFVLPIRNAGTLWSNLLVAVLVFAFSLVPGGETPISPPRPARSAA